MIDGMFVINAVVHTWNLNPTNVQPNRFAQSMLKEFFAGHCTWNPPPIEPMSADQFITDWDVHVNAKTLFLETDCDLAVHHSLGLYSYFKDGLTPHSKTATLLDKYPERFLGYVAVDPTQGLEACLRDLDKQLDRTPQAVGLKLYPAQVEPLRYVAMDDREVMFPLYERCLERGLKVVAIHKALPQGPVPMTAYHIEDVEGAASQFPDLAFEIVHGGMAFVRETALALARYPNVYVNLEVTSSLAFKAPRLFEETMAELILWGGTEKILYGDGGALGRHSQPILEAVKAFQFSDEICAGYGVTKLTDKDRALILGGNYARMVGLDIEAAKAKIADDGFSQKRRETGRQTPFSNWKALSA
jgi:predicted TIM-barrel fold metal-dependent hydrolase